MKIVKEVIHSFSKDNPASLDANPGEILLFKTMDCFAGQLTSEDQLLKDLDLNKSNPSTGPVYIKGAEKGDVLVVDILDIKVGNQGFACSIPGVGPMQDLVESRTRLIPIKNGMAEYNGIKWKINPMIGVIGTAPERESIPCGYSSNHGGNMDSKKIIKGSRVYLPVRVDGGLLAMGDLHATMGDGEISETGIEVSGEILVKIDLIKNFELNWPVTETPTNWYVNVTEDNYDEALISATHEMDRLMRPVYGWDSTDTLIYFSLQADVEINQGARPAHEDMFNLRFGIPKTDGKEALIK